MRLIAFLLALQTVSGHLDRAIAELTAARDLLTNRVVVLGDLQAAVDAGPPGAVYVLSPSVTYGPVTLREKGGTLTTDGFSAAGRVSPEATLATIAGAPGAVAVRVESGTWTLRGVKAIADANEVILLSEGAITPVVDRSVILGDPQTGAKRGITLNSQGGTVTDSWIDDIKRPGQDAVGIGMFNGPGPYTITNSRISASGSAIMAGGSDPTVTGLVPSDLTITDNLLTKNPAWKGIWLVKNGFELKNARRVRFLRNTVEQSWTHGQTGFGITLTVRNQDGGCPWCTIDDVTIAQNAIRLVGAGVQILGRDSNHSSAVMTNVAIADNAFSICNTGAGRQVEISGGPINLSLSGNVFTSCAGQYLGTFLAFSGPTLLGFSAIGNRFEEGEYGIHSADAALGTATLERYAPGYVWRDNVVTKGNTGRWIPYPDGTSVQ